MQISGRKLIVQMSPLIFFLVQVPVSPCQDGALGGCPCCLYLNPPLIPWGVGKMCVGLWDSEQQSWFHLYVYLYYLSYLYSMCAIYTVLLTLYIYIHIHCIYSICTICIVYTLYSLSLQYICVGLRLR